MIFEKIMTTGQITTEKADMSGKGNIADERKKLVHSLNQVPCQFTANSTAFGIL